MFENAAQWYLLSTYNITVTWRPARAVDTSGYEIWHSRLAGGPYYRLDIVRDKKAYQYTVPNMDTGRHYFVMTSFDRKGNRSLRSKEVQLEI